MVWYGMAWHDTAWNGMAWHDGAWFSMAWDNTLWYGDKPTKREPAKRQR